MDTRTQFYARVIIGFILTFISFLACSQCTDSINVVYVDSCQRVQMSPETFTELYVCKKNLGILSKEIPKAKHLVDSVDKVNKALHENYQAQVDSSNRKNSILERGLDNCYETAVELDLENIYLSDMNNKLHKRKWIWCGGGTIVGGILVHCIKSLFFR